MGSASAPGWQPLLDRLAREQDPTRRRNLEVVGRHVVEEVAGNMDQLMATLIPEPSYTVWGASDSVGPHGRDEVLAWYHALIESGRNRLDYVLHRVVVDEETVVTEGDFHYAFAGRELSGEYAESGEQIRPDGRYLVSHRAVVLWPVNSEGLIEGEHIYAGEHHRVIRELGVNEKPELGTAGGKRP